jgi:hypothetical protein
MSHQARVRCPRRSFRITLSDETATDVFGCIGDLSCVRLGADPSNCAKEKGPFSPGGAFSQPVTD